MPGTIDLKIPTGSFEGWRSIVESAKDVYWRRRRNGEGENDALVAALDEAVSIATAGQRK